MQVIQKKRAEKPEQRQASREAALRWVPRGSSLAARLVPSASVLPPEQS